jgi:hypothetical protein
MYSVHITYPGEIDRFWKLYEAHVILCPVSVCPICGKIRYYENCAFWVRDKINLSERKR